MSMVFVNSRIDVESVPEGLEHMENKSGQAVEKAEAEHIAIQEIAECPEE